MSRLSIIVACVVAAAAAPAIGEAPMSAAELHAATAVVDITPPPGYRMSGYFSERLSTGVSDPLKAKALVMRQGGVRAAMVFCDIIGISPAVSARARERAAKKTGIPAANIVVAATHTHTGPLYFGALRKHFHDRAVAAGGSDPKEKVDYPAELTGRIVEAIVQADATVAPVRIAAGSARQESLSFNRRFHMKGGGVRFNPGVLNPDIVRAAGPIDPEVGVVVLGTDFAKPQAAIVNFALHLDTVGGTKYAADYPYYAEQTLRERLGEQFVLLFGTGACGDLNHIDVTKRERLKTDHIGTTLGKTVAAKVAELRQAAEPALAVRREIVHAPLQQLTDRRLAWARQNVVRIGTRELPFLKQVEAYKILALELRGGRMIPLEVQAFRLSREVAVVTLPGEIFVDLGLAIKRASPFATTLVVELCNDAPGYVPTKKAFAEGSYETVNSRIAPGGGEMLVEAATRLLKELGK